MQHLTTDAVRRAFTANAPTNRPLLPDNNFFEAGFTSIRLAAVRAELLDAGVEVTLVDLFRHPTLAELTSELLARSTPGRARSGHRLPWDVSERVNER